MDKRVINGGIIALLIIVALIFGCIWLGKKIWNAATNRTETTETTQPEQPTRPTNQPITNLEQAQKTYLALGNPSNATQKYRKCRQLFDGQQRLRAFV